MKTIFRESVARNFNKLPHFISRDRTLTFTARGILAFALSQADGWVLTMEQLESESPLGRKAIRSAIIELERSGHAVRRQGFNPLTKKFSGTVWTWHQEPVQISQRSTGKKPQKTICPNTIGTFTTSTMVTVVKGSDIRRLYIEDHREENKVCKEEDYHRGRGVPPEGDVGWYGLKEVDLAGF